MATIEELQAAIDEGLTITTNPSETPVLRVTIESLGEHDSVEKTVVVLLTPGKHIKVEAKAPTSDA